MSNSNLKPRILIVDDSMVARRLLSGQFRELGHTNLVEAETAERAMELLLESRKGVAFSLIVTDLRMPGMSGVDFIKTIQREPDFKAIPKLILSVETDRGVVLNSMLTGAAGYVIKPSTTQVLKEKLDKIFASEKTA